MPSYIGHITCGEKLLERLNISYEDKIKFRIGNIVPDIKQVDIDLNLDEFINKRRIQKSKRITHFRKNTNFILEYPHCNRFLDKYEEEVKSHIETLAYFFHLYTDYYYFKEFLPKTITFLNDNLKEVEERNGFSYVKINKTDRILKARTFFSKRSVRGLYKEYMRSNSYLIHRFNLYNITDIIREYLKDNKYNCYVEEIDISNIDEVLNKIDRIYLKKGDSPKLLYTFEEEKLDEFIEEVVDSFIKEYSYLIDKYLYTK